MAKTSGGVRQYGELGYALYDSSGKQISRALFSQGTPFKSSKEMARALVKNYKEANGQTVKIRKARNRYGD